MPFDATPPALGDLAHFEGWLSRQPRETTFRYVSANDCLLSRYARAHGGKEVFCGAMGVIVVDGLRHDWGHLAGYVNRGTAPEYETTYGEVVDAVKARKPSMFYA